MPEKLLLTGLFFVLCQLTTMAQPALPPGATTATFRLYVLAGQSNMAGRGTVEALDKTSHPRVWMLSKDNQWVPATDPMHFDKPEVVGVGPSLTFGKQMADADSTVFIGLIPTAVGGSAIDAWQPNGYHEQTESHPYDDALKRVQLVRNQGTLAGMLWHQGESDSKPELAADYRTKLVGLIGRFRQVLAAPNLPVVVGTLGDFYVAKNPVARQINATLRALPGQETRVACVDASGLTDRGDQTHFDTPSARELGWRYADAMKIVQAN